MYVFATGEALIVDKGTVEIWKFELESNNNIERVGLADNFIPFPSAVEANEATTSALAAGFKYTESLYVVP